MARRKKNDEEPKENEDNLNNNSDDTFGLPEVEYEPLKREETDVPAETPPEPLEEPVATEPVEEPVYEKPYETTPVEQVPYQEPTPHHEYTHHSYSYEPEPQPVWPKILGIAALLFIVGMGVWFFAYYQPKQKEIEAQERLAAETSRKAAEDARRKKAAEDERLRAAEQRRLDSLAAIPTVGTLEILSQRTGRYHVVVASNVDDDLLTDFANQLIKKGKSVKIIPPFGKKGRFYRLAVDSKDTYADAQATADGMKGGDFGDQIWVVRY